MRSTIIIAAMLISTALLTGQNTNEKRVVRIKKVETINGVEKVIDTTYTVEGPVTLKTFPELSNQDHKTDGNEKRVVVITDQINGDNSTNITIVDKDAEMDEQIESALKAAGVNSKNASVDKIVMVNVDTEVNDKKGDNKATKIVVIKRVKITELNEEDKKMLGKQTGLGDNKLGLDKMTFYPNPNTGKFTLDFNLADKGNTAVSIFNVEGKSVYSEQLKDFSGNYKKEIDISSNPKGVYFVKISQGDHAQLKKIVLE